MLLVEVGHAAEPTRPFVNAQRRPRRCAAPGRLAGLFRCRPARRASRSPRCRPGAPGCGRIAATLGAKGFASRSIGAASQTSVRKGLAPRLDRSSIVSGSVRSHPLALRRAGAKRAGGAAMAGSRLALPSLALTAATRIARDLLRRHAPRRSRSGSRRSCWRRSPAGAGRDRRAGPECAPTGA